MDQLGDFAIEGVLGEGGSAVVYAARGEDGAALALKVAREDAVPTARDRRRFLEEAARLGRVDHPAVVRVVSAGLLPDGRPFVAMPRLVGETLASRLARGRMAVAEAIAMFEALAEGVSALHEAGLIHRDLKPENVLLAGEPPAPVLLDLGIARELDAPASTTTARGAVRGTPATMAPERLFGQPASVASDVYELGLVLYVMLVGALPWEDTADVDARLSAAAPSAVVAEIPDALSEAILRALSTRVEKRPVSARALARLVREAAGTDVTIAPAPPARRTVTLAPEPRRSPPQALDAPLSSPRPARGGPLASAGVGLAVALAVVFASRLPIFAPAPTAPPVVTGAPEASIAAPIAPEPTSAAPIVSASSERITLAAPAVAAASRVRASASASAKPDVGAGACARFLAFACADPQSQGCNLAKFAHNSIDRSTPEKAEKNCEKELAHFIKERAQDQLDAENLARSPACARYLGAACAPHVRSLRDGSSLCIQVKRFAKERAAEGAAGEAACSAAEVGLPAVLQGLAQKVEERWVPERPPVFGAGM